MNLLLNFQKNKIFKNKQITLKILNLIATMEPTKLDLSYKQFDQFVQKGALIIDTRQRQRFMEEFIPGSYNVGLTDVFEKWINNLFTPEQAMVLICDRDTERTALKRLQNIGYEDNVLGYLKNGVEQYKAYANLVQNPTRTCPILTEKEFAQYYSLSQDPQSQFVILDVRSADEIKNEGAIQGSLNVNVFQLEQKIKENLDLLNKDKSYYIHCKSGWRACLAASILAKYGFHNAASIGGFQALKETGLPCNEPLKKTF